MLSILSCVCWQSVYLLWRNVYLGVLPIFGLGCLFFWCWAAWAACKFWRLMLCQKWCFIDSLHDPDLRVIMVGHVTLYKIKKLYDFFKELSCWCWENVALYGWAGVPAYGEVWLMRNAHTQCTVRGERRPKGREELLCLDFSCLAIKYEFYFT